MREHEGARREGMVEGQKRKRKGVGGKERENETANIYPSASLTCLDVDDFPHGAVVCWCGVEFRGDRGAATAGGMAFDF